MGPIRTVMILIPFNENYLLMVNMMQRNYAGLRKRSIDPHLFAPWFRTLANIVETGASNAGV